MAYENREQKIDRLAHEEKARIEAEFARREREFMRSDNDSKGQIKRLKKEIEHANSNLSLDDVMRRILSRERGKSDEYLLAVSDQIAGLEKEIGAVKASGNREVMQYLKNLSSEIEGLRDTVSMETAQRNAENRRLRHEEDERRRFEYDEDEHAGTREPASSSSERPRENQPEKKPVLVASTNKYQTRSVMINNTTYDPGDGVEVYDDGDSYKVVKKPTMDSANSWETRMPKLTTQVTEVR